MSDTLNFDTIIDRKNTSCVKFDALKEYFGEENLTPLWVADTDFAIMPEITDALRHRLEHPVFGYAITRDSYWQSIIDWQKRRNGYTISRDELISIPGVVKAIAYAVNFFTTKEDKIVIQPPVYHPFKSVIEANHRTVVTNPLRLVESEKGVEYQMNLDHLEQTFINEKPKMMILCNPHNPVGICWSKETLRRVANLANRHGVIIVSDEIHSDLILNHQPHNVFASVSDDAAKVAITFCAPTKTFNFASIIGSWCFIKNPNLREDFFNWLTSNGFAEASEASTIATETAYNTGDRWVYQLIEYLNRNIDFVDYYCRSHIPQIKVVRPQASFLLWLDCRELNLDHDSLNRLFVEKAKLALNDGEMFGAEGAGFMRMNIASPLKVLQIALDRLKNAVQKYL